MAKSVNDFNIGDTVKIVSGDGGGNTGLTYGSITTVSDKNDAFIYVNGENKRSGLGLVPYNLEVIEPAPAAPVVSKVDFTKPLQTRGGCSVTLVTTEGRGKYPVLAYIGQSNNISTFTTGGRYFVGSEENVDIINVPKKPAIIEHYFNMYADGTIGSKFSTRAEADQRATTVERNMGHKRIGVQKVAFTEGVFDA